MKRYTDLQRKPKKNRKTESNISGRKHVTRRKQHSDHSGPSFASHKLSDKVNRPEDATESEIKRLPMEKMESPSLWKVRIMHPAAFGESKGVRKMEESACWWIGPNKLSTLASD